MIKLMNKNSYQQNICVNKRDIKFKGIFINDVGASDELGSRKSALYSEDGKLIHETKGTVFKERSKISSTGFSDELATSLINDFKDFVPENDPIKAIIITPPGQPTNKVINIIQNIKDSNNQPLKDVVIDVLSKLKGKLNIAANCKEIVVNDMAGGGAKALQIMIKEGAKPGTKGCYIAVGGGCGVVNFTTGAKVSTIETGEKGHTFLRMKIIDHKKVPETVESSSASKDAFIRNWCNEIGLDKKHTQKLMKEGDARILTNFDIAKTKVGTHLSHEKFTEASHKAINKFIKEISVVLQNEVNNRVKEGFLGGHIINSIKTDFIDNNLNLFEKRLNKFDMLCPEKKNLGNLEKLILLKIYHSSDPMSRSFIRKDFSLRTVDIKNNITDLLAHAKPEGAIIKISNKILKTGGKLI